MGLNDTLASNTDVLVCQATYQAASREAACMDKIKNANKNLAFFPQDFILALFIDNKAIHIPALEGLES